MQGITQARASGIRQRRWIASAARWRFRASSLPAAVMLLRAAICAGCVVLAVATAARADMPQAMAIALSDKAFAMLDGLSRGGGSASPMLGAMASFSGDAQTLAAALGRNDRTAVANALDTLRSDRATVDAT